APVAANNEILIRSPMVGTFYLAADPESPPFVNIGTLVEPNTVVCLIEAMKVFNELKAEVSGRITKILAKNAQAIEFDQPLFAVAPA
ncbi:MAG TPA: acetyl-CoA carboxylase, biotin carboxyl carrier protein, partial [Phycisphaerae bacterium]|nr:acetyl-CoA carboxylase, biotin carboxyl carrier protein [Phycisphaerae bacterium]